MLTEELLASISVWLKNFFKIGIIIGFISGVTLLINLDHKAFEVFFKEKANTVWWLFCLSTLIFLFIILYIFSFIFGR